MKMRLFAVICVALATLQGCTYSEGPNLSFRSKAGRLDGRWNCTFLEAVSTPKTGDSLIYTFDKKVLALQLPKLKCRLVSIIPLRLT